MLMTPSMSVIRGMKFASFLMALASFYPDAVVGQSFSSHTAFSPRQGATALVVETIGAARQTVYLVGYSFTSEAVAQALTEAFQRGVDVRVVLDAKASRQRHSEGGKLALAGIPVRLDAQHAITHDKFIVIDGETVETGSFNYTQSAETRNAENVLVVHDQAVAHDYEIQWQKLWDEADPITDRENRNDVKR